MSTRLILLAEDNIVNQKVAVRQLQKLGYRADTVANGKEALEALRRISYDLVLMDCQMPEMDGYETTGKIRAGAGGLKNIPIVAMTANALEGDRAKCIAAGMDDYVTKPVKPEELKRVLDPFLWDGNPDAAEQREATNTPPVDLDRMREMFGDEPDEQEEILNLYLDQMTRSLKKLADDIASNNYEEVELVAHNCAGTSANCGMTAVAVPLQELEHAGRNRQLENAPAMLAQANALFQSTREFLARSPIMN